MLEFIKDFKSVTLATVNEEFFPHASFAPFVHLNHKYYIFISKLAQHTKNLESSNEASILFIEDEGSCEQVFARKRVSLLCETQEILRDNPEFDEVMEVFAKKFDETLIETLKGMSDFLLFELTPIQGEAIFGFGLAYDIGGPYFEDLLDRRDSDGHGHRKEDS
ncbi:MAG: pyridoxamine 5'-phosphate oxidase family protein [Thiovulaceae bacterium]|nr:pyridoxamine 5'-phosphate oxidase family protein [Sulfurimonadaceae bacterium]